MTALHGLDRLEAPGLWRPSHDDQRREVYVTVGNAELVIEDRTGTALSHWSLPALVRLNPGEAPALFGPGPGSDEVLEIEEPEMVAALDRVITAVEKGRRRPGALRRVTVGIVLGFAVGLSVLWLPGALREQAATLIPAAKRADIGARMLREMTGLTGPACSNPTGIEALAQLRDRIFPVRPLTLVVLRDLPQDTIALPGGTIALTDLLLLTQDDPDVLAGHAVAAAKAAQVHAPFEAFLEGMGFFNLTRMLTTGEVPQQAISDHVDRLILEPQPLPGADVLRPAFDAARLAWAPYAAETGQPVGAAPPSRMPPAMDDTPWQALREICSR